MSAKHAKVVSGLASVIAVLAAALGCGQARADDEDGVVCRLQYVRDFQSEHFEAQLFLPPTLATRPDQMVVYITRRPDGHIYIHSNYQTPIRKAGAAQLEKDRLGQPLSDIEKQAVNLFRSESVRIDGVWRFRCPTKVVLAKEKEISKYLELLMSNGDPMDKAELKAIAQATVGGSMKIILSPSAADMNLGPAKKVEKASFDRRQVGVVMREKIIPGFKKEYEQAISLLGAETTTELKDCRVFITRRSDGLLYLQTNYRPMMANQTRSHFPSKLITRGEKNLFFLLTMMAWPDDPPHRGDKRLSDLVSFQLNDIRYLVTPEALKVLDLPPAGKVEKVE